MMAGRFPRSRDVEGEARWLESEIDAWILSRPIKRLKGDIVNAA
jgi:predicted DNA-binding transcriptional regulator AlpA